MKDILEYTNYRQYIADYYADKKAKSAFTWQEFATSAGFSSPVYLKYVSEGRFNLSEAAADRMARLMNLADYEREFFVEMVRFDHAKTDAEKRAAFSKMVSIGEAHKAKVVDAESFRFFEDWKKPVLRELAPAMPGAMPKEIANKCVNEVSAREIVDSIKFQVDSGFLKRVGDSAYVQTDKLIAGDTQSISLAVRSMNRQMASFAVDAIDRFSAEERFISGITMGVSNDAYGKIVEVLRKCREQVQNIILKDDKVEQVLRLNLQLFPLTQKLDRRENEK